MSQELLDTVMDTVDAQKEKVDAHDKEISTLKEAMTSLLDCKELVAALGKQVGNLKAIVMLYFPVQDMKILSANLAADIEARKEPLKVKHHHYLNWAICVAAGLFLSLTLVCTRWYMTGEKLQQYKAGDTKYRLLKFQSNKPLQKLLDETDSLYQQNPGHIRDSVLQLEEAQLRDYELNKQAAEMEEEAKSLRKKAANKKQ